MVQSNRLRKYSRLLPLIILVFITFLSGCSQPSPTFNPERAIFFNPVTNENHKIYGENLNKSGLNFHHLDKIELIVGLKDLEGNPGMNYTLSLNIVYLEFGGSRNTTINLSKVLNIHLITNTSGIARSSFIYDQYDWPKSSYTTAGYFTIFCSKVTNRTAISDTFSFRYYDSELSRNSTTLGGLKAIQSIEMMNLLEEALNLGGTNNSYEEIVFSRSDLLYLIINASVIDRFESRMSAPRIEFIYKAWAIELEKNNLTYSSLNSIWRDYMNFMIPEPFPTERWYSTGPISQLNITDGWLVLQYLSYYYFAGLLNTEWWYIYQFAVVTTDFQLLWLTSYLEHAYT